MLWGHGNANYMKFETFVQLHYSTLITTTEFSNTISDCLVPLTTVSRRGIPESILSNKLNRLTMATFDDEGKKALLNYSSRVLN